MLIWMLRRLDQHFQYHFGEGLLDFADCTFEKVLAQNSCQERTVAP